ncbi:MAG: hypothetical protein WAZ77_22140 [Candidatus Nitrosopolaris sp.]
MRKQHELEFGLTIPQGWRGGDLPLEEENDPVKQYEFSKPPYQLQLIVLDLIQFMHTIILFHFIVMIEIKILLNVLLFYQL